MATEVIMPKAGIDMTEGQIIKWNKKEGEKVEEGEILLEIMTDKTSMELEAEESGYLIKIVKGDGETVPVTEIIGYTGAEGEVAPEAGSANTASTAPAQASQPKSENMAQPAPKKEKAEEYLYYVKNIYNFLIFISDSSLYTLVYLRNKVN